MSDTAPVPALIDHLWYGPLPAVQAAIEGQNNVIGPRVLDDTAYVTVRSATPLPLPAGLSTVGPSLANVVMGQWMGDPAKVPPQITIRQFLLGLSRDEIITQQEARDAAASGAVPEFVQNVFATFPPDQAFEAEMTWRAMTVVERSNPLLAMLGGMLGMTTEQMDATFIKWSAI